jgi:hypothetical protein
VIGWWADTRGNEHDYEPRSQSPKTAGYAFVGLLAGDAILLLFFPQNAIRSRADLLASHMGDPARQIPLALQMFAIYASFSFVGWLFVGASYGTVVPGAFHHAFVVAS